MIDPRLPNNLERIMKECNEETKPCEHDFNRLKDPRKMKCRKCGFLTRFDMKWFETKETRELEAIIDDLSKQLERLNGV